MYAGVVHAGGLASLNDLGSPLEAIISQSRWRQSFRARQDVLHRAHQHLEYLIRARVSGGQLATANLPPGGCFAQLVADVELR